MTKALCKCGGGRYAAAVLLMLILLWGIWQSVPPLAQALREQPPGIPVQLERTDLPGFEALPAALYPDGTIRTANQCAEAVPATLVDERGRAWRLSARDYSFLWVETCQTGALVHARHTRTGVRISFYLGEDPVGAYPICLGPGLVINALPRTRTFLGHTFVAPCCHRQDFRTFADNLQIEEISPEEVGQTVAFGQDLNVRQTADFSTGLLCVDQTDTGVHTTLLYDPPLWQTAPNTCRYTNPAGLTWELQWLPPDPETLANRGMTLFASCGRSGFVQIDLPPASFCQEEAPAVPQALQAAQQALDRFSPCTA